MIPIYLLNLIGGLGCLTACDTPLFLLLEAGDLCIYSIQYRNTLMTLLPLVFLRKLGVATLRNHLWLVRSLALLPLNAE